MDNAQVGHEAGFGQVQVVLPQLTRVKLAFVDYGLGRQGTDVEPGVLIGDGVGGNLIIQNLILNKGRLKKKTRIFHDIVH